MGRLNIRPLAGEIDEKQSAVKLHTVFGGTGPRSNNSACRKNTRYSKMNYLIIINPVFFSIIPSFLDFVLPPVELGSAID